MQAVVVFDVNETLSDLAPMGARFTDVGARAVLAKVWFASLLRDGFALAAAGSSARFADIGSGALRVLLAGLELNREPDAAVEHIMAGFGALSVHPDVPEGVRRLHARGQRLVTLSNGGAEVADRLLTEAGIRPLFERLLSVEQAGVWKPAAGAYAHAAQECGVPPAELLLVAVHPWDTDGAARAGLATAWLNRAGGPYPDYFTPPDRIVRELAELAEDR